MTIADRLAAKEKQELEIIEPLSPKDAADWKRLRKEVSLHQDAVCAFAECLTDIRDRRLYREEYGTFDAYVAAELSLSKRHINRLIHHEEVKRILGPSVPNLPETHSRELVNVPPKKIPAIIKKADAKAKSEGRKREAKDVKAVVKEDVTVPKKVKADDEELPEDETIEEVCERESSEIESWARRLSSLLTEAQEAMSEFPTLDELNARTGWERKLKEALSTLRNTKPVVCPMCDGDNKKCPCKGNGRVTKQQYKQMV